MSVFWAILGDTWRQSVQQVVFLIVAALMLLASAIFVILPSVHVDEQGRQVLGLIGDKQPGATYERKWDGLYTESINRQLDRDSRLDAERAAFGVAELAWRNAQAEMRAAERAGAPQEQMDEHIRVVEAARLEVVAAADQLERVRKLVRDEAGVRVDETKARLTPLQQGVHFWLDGALQILFWVSLLGFIAASAGFFPGLLQSGAVDVVLSRPVSRPTVFLAKYMGGLLLYALALLGAVLVLFAGIGLKLGVWHTGLFLALPMMLFSALLLYAIVALIGVRTKSTALAMGLGYFFLVLVDWALSQIQAGALADFAGLEWLKPVAAVLRVTFPNFRTLQFWSSAFALGVPIFEWPLFVTAAVWLAICVGAGVYLFRKADY